MVDKTNQLEQCPCCPSTRCRMSESCRGCETYSQWLNRSTRADEGLSEALIESLVDVGYRLHVHDSIDGKYPDGLDRDEWEKQEIEEILRLDALSPKDKEHRCRKCKLDGNCSWQGLCREDECTTDFTAKDKVVGS